MAQRRARDIEAAPREQCDAETTHTGAVRQPHTTQADWTPDITPALFIEVSIEEWPEIPEVIPAEAPWMKGDKGTWKGRHYICQMDNCVWNPDTYPAAWELVEN